MGIHAGGAECRDGDGDGPTLNRAARVHVDRPRRTGPVSDARGDLTRTDLPPGAAFADLGITMMYCRVDLADLLGEAGQCRAFVLVKVEVGQTSGW
jgi:hypothetical protein